MQIVIEIPDRIYESVQDGTYCGTLYKELKNGTPLPKGHGRLIDADDLYNSLEFPTQQFASAFKQVLDDAPTIIEADKESEEEE